MADKTVPDLIAAGPLDGTELLHVVQGGNSRKTTLQAIMDEVTPVLAIGDVTDLQDALDAKLDDSQAGAAGLAMLAAESEAALLDALGLGMGAALGIASPEMILGGTDTDNAATADSIAALWEQGADVASAATVSLGEGGYFVITGTTAITDIDFATDHAGRCAWVKFAGALTLTHGAGALILPGGANIATAAGDTACFVSEGADVVRCVAYTRASGAALVGGSPSGSITASGYTQSTGKLLGRNTALPGAIEEITLGTNLSMTGTTLNASGGGGSAWQLSWFPKDNEPPAANYATLDTRNGHPTLDFDTTTQELGCFRDFLPASYTGAGVTITLVVALTSATSGTVGFDVAFERIDASSLDIDADGFGAATTITATAVPATSGQVLYLTVNVSNGTNMDSLAAGEMFRLRVRRDVANDTAAGDAELLGVKMVSQ